MIYAYEQPIQMPTRDLYDTQMMLAAVNAAKDMYEKGQQQMKDFYTKYGDFMSPFAKDMEWYGGEMGRIRDIVDQAYANGIDLFKSPEGRMLVNQLTNSINPRDYNNAKANAAIGYKYLEAVREARAKGEFDPAFENWRLNQLGLGSFEDFSSAGGKIWGESGPGTYKDLNQFTSHIFDNMKDSFLGTGADHYDYYGVSREDRARALTQHLSGLLNTELGQYHYKNSKEAYEKILGRRLSDKEAMEMWQSDILDATSEYEHRNRKLNEIWKMQQENAARIAAGRASGSGGGSRTNDAYPWSFAEVVRRNAATSIMGQQIQEYSDNTLNGIRDEMIRFGKQVSDDTGGHSFKYSGKQAFKQKYSQNRYGVQDINNFLSPQGFSVIDERTGTMLLPKGQIGRLKTDDDIISNTVGFRGRTVSSNNDWLNDADIITVTPTTGSYGALMKNKGAARFENHFEVDVVAYKNVPAFDPKDNQPLYNSDGTRQMTRKAVGKKRLYLDSHITSIPSAQGTGWLGTVDTKGRINNTPNLTVTNTQDHRYQDAVQGDKAATDAIIKGTGYISDGIPSELPLYGK